MVADDLNRIGDDFTTSVTEERDDYNRKWLSAHHDCSQSRMLVVGAITNLIETLFSRRLSSANRDMRDGSHVGR